MLERIVAIALRNSGRTPVELQDAHFAELVSEGRSAVARANSGSYDTDILPLRFGVARFGLAMNTSNVSEARRLAAASAPCGLSEDWAVERAWFIRFGEFLLDEAQRHLPETLRALVETTLAHAGQDGLIRDCIDPMLFSYLTVEARAARHIEHERGDSPDETVLPWLCGGNELRVGPSCLGYALFTAAALRLLKRRTCLLNVPLNGSWAMAHFEGQVVSDLLRFAREASIWFPQRLGDTLLRASALAGEYPEGHVAVASQGFDGCWELHDGYQRQFPVEEPSGEIHLSQAVLKAYQRTGLSRLVRSSAIDDAAVSSIPVIERFKNAAAEAVRFASVHGSAQAAYHNLARFWPAELFAPNRESAGNGDHARGIMVSCLLALSGPGGDLYRCASGPVREQYHEIDRETGEGLRPEDNPRVSALGRLAGEDRPFLEALLKRLPSVFISLCVRGLVQELERMRSKCRHPEVEVIDREFGFGALILANCARNAGLSLEIERILFEHCTLLERYMFWADHARHSAGDDPRERFSLELLSKLPTKHPEVEFLLSGRER